MPFWKRQHDCEQLHGMDWYNSVAEVLADVRACHKSPLLKATINSAQCCQLACIFSSKLSKFWPLSPPLPLEDSDSGSSSSSRRASLSHRTNSSASLLLMANERADSEHLAVLDECKHALKEVYRVIKELEAFVLACSVQDWWKSALFRGYNGEAVAVHIHNLVWSVAALDIAIHQAKGSPLELIDAVCSRRIAECYAEMSCMSHQLHEQADRKQVLSMLTSLQEQFRRFSKRKKRTLRVDEENKYRISGYFLQKLQNHVTSGVALSHELPVSLSIDPKDIDFSRRRLLGRGSYGAVYEASWFGMKVAVKELPCDDSQLFKQEASILARLCSPFIVQLIGWSIDEEANVCHLVMELCSNNLRSHIERRSNRGSPFALPVAVDIMLQIARGMEYLHSQRVVHRDLRASNVLVDDSNVREFLDEGHVRVKLCDFGMAKAKLNSSRFVSSMAGTTYWRAPEVFSDPDASETNDTLKRRYTDKADVYSFAMTCYEILTGQIPFDGTMRKQMYEFITNGGRPHLPASCPSVLADYLRRCWHGDDKCRPSFRDISRFLSHVKLLLLRVDDPDDATFQSATTEFDYLELSSSVNRVSLSSGGSSFNEQQTISYNEEDGKAQKLPLQDPCNSLVRPGRTSTFQKLRSAILYGTKPVEIEPREALIINCVPCFITKYSLQDLRTATANFSTRICNGEAGSVFRGVLSDDMVIAVKFVRVDALEDVRQFCMMIMALSNAYHANLVRFRGYCIDVADHFLLVSEYLDNQSLDKWLSSLKDGSCLKESEFAQEDCGLDWETRLNIAIGAARGLTYLHDDCGNCILPVGVNSSKILLSKQFVAKVNILTLVDLDRKPQYFTYKLPFEKTNSNSPVLSLEAQSAQRVDVYSFGLILFELLVGHAVDLPMVAPEEGLVSLLKKPAEFFRCLGGQHPLSALSTDEIERQSPGPLDQAHILDISSRRQESGITEKATKLFRTALWCVQDCESRPTMSQILQVLEGKLTIPEELRDSLSSIM